MEGWWRWALVSPDGVAPSQMVGVSASVNLPCTIKYRSYFLAPAHLGSPGQRAVKRLWCGGHAVFMVQLSFDYLYYLLAAELFIIAVLWDHGDLVDQFCGHVSDYRCARLWNNFSGGVLSSYEG